MWDCIRHSFPIVYLLADYCLNPVKFLTRHLLIQFFIMLVYTVSNGLFYWLTGTQLHFGGITVSMSVDLAFWFIFFGMLSAGLVLWGNNKIKAHMFE